MTDSVLGMLYFAAFSHGLFLTISLWRRSTSSSPSRWLALMTALISYKLYEGSASFMKLYPWLGHTMDLLPFVVLSIGPVFYFYVSAIADKSKKRSLLSLCHFIPAGLAWIANAPRVFRPLEQKVQMWDFINQPSQDALLPLFWVCILILVKVHFSTYLWLAWKKLDQFKQLISAIRADGSQDLLWQLKFILISLIALETLWVSLFLLQQYAGVGTLSSVSDIWLFFLAAMLMFAGYVGLQKPSFIFSSEELSILESAQQQGQLQETGSKVKYLHTALPESAAEQISQEIEQAISKEKYFLNEKLTLTDLSDALGLKSHTVSQVINQHMQTNFYKLINGYRVNYAIELIEQRGQQWTLERIAIESGFNNRVTFNKAFKELLGCSPSSYKKQHLQQQNRA